MRQWRKKLFLTLANNAASPAAPDTGLKPR
jgi:hypothetical protein